jgi:anti-sigma-K factor RskA
MTDERFDLSPLDPQEDARFERMVGRITERARFELARRRGAQRQSVVELVAGWARPALVAAAAIAGVSLTLLATFDRSNAGVVVTGAYMPASEVPATATSWYEEDRDPTVEDLLVSVSDVQGQGDDQ